MQTFINETQTNALGSGRRAHFSYIYPSKLSEYNGSASSVHKKPSNRAAYDIHGAGTSEVDHHTRAKRVRMKAHVGILVHSSDQMFESNQKTSIARTILPQMFGPI